MKILFWIVLGFVIYIFASRMIPVKGIDNISVSQFKGILRNKNIQMIDVRTPGEYKSNHIKQFRNIPLQVLKQSIQQLDKEKTIIVICQSGMRSMQAAKILKHAGFTDIKNVSGGMNNWS